jgi:hypothetical protein
MRSLLSLALVVMAVGCGSVAEAPSSSVGPEADGAIDVDSSAPVDASLADTSSEDTAVLTPLDSHHAAADTHVEYDFGPPPDGAPEIMVPPEASAGCNELSQKGSLIAPVAWTDPLPAFTGGTISEGTYVLTKLAITDGASSSARAETVAFSGTTFEARVDVGAVTARVRGNFSASASTLTTTTTCPKAGDVDSGQYTATPTTLVIYDAVEHELAFYDKS